MKFYSLCYKDGQTKSSHWTLLASKIYDCMHLRHFTLHLGKLAKPQIIQSTPKNIMPSINYSCSKACISYMIIESIEIMSEVNNISGPASH